MEAVGYMTDDQPSQSLKGKRGPPVRKSPKKYAPINMDIINRLSKPRQKKKPSKYHVQPSSATGRWSKPGGGRFSNARPKSDIEIKMLRAAETPGPGQYKLPQFGSGKGGIRISDANPLSDIDLKMIRAAETPGPNQYNVAHDYSKMGGGRFSTAKPMTSTEIIMLHCKPHSRP